ncbi:Gluconate 2-dehydrogenase flavoprotein precursor [Serratia fonticola]|uniref:Gluconate 2-dehydrogenase flavoprotein n=1 Tax=Serratia fonticola TaxID=47917 RepID=A0A4U9W5B8_SERFO|nr:Gluconate 2-dehydrogenase flavoprotein precursor [Serratia fonticola]
MTYGIRLKLEQEMAHETVTVRHTPADFAVPYRQLGSFLPGNGVGGAGVHWNGMHWRALPADLKMRTTVTEKYGDKWVPEGMLLQDYPLSYTELEPYFDKFEKVCGTSGKAGNLQGNIVKGGNPFEGHAPANIPLRPSSSSILVRCLARRPSRSAITRSAFQRPTARSLIPIPTACNSALVTTAVTVSASAALCTPRPHRKPPFCRC